MLSWILTPLGILALILGSFLISNTMSALIAQQTRQIGVMKAVGADLGQIVGMYLVAVVVYGLAALLIAIPLTIGLATLLELVLSDALALLLFGRRGFAVAGDCRWVSHDRQLSAGVQCLPHDGARDWPMSNDQRVRCTGQTLILLDESLRPCNAHALPPT